MSEDWKQDEHWKRVANGGIVISTTPQQLWDAATEYFLWTDENPIVAKRTLTSGKEAGKHVEQQYKRPYTVKAMCLHCGISERYIQDISQSQAKDSEWYMVVEKIMMIIYTQVLEGALVDLYNPIMASKMLNMDKEGDNPNAVVKIEIINSTSNELSNSENEVLAKLDFEKVISLKEKAENVKR